MDEDRRIPVSLRVVAVLFIVGGICAVIEVVVGLAHQHVSINFGVLGLFIGPGLLALRRGWRTCALVFLWIAMIGIPIITILMVGHSGPLDFKVFGQKVGHVPKELGFAIAGILFLLSLWQYRVLTRDMFVCFLEFRPGNRSPQWIRMSRVVEIGRYNRCWMYRD